MTFAHIPVLENEYFIQQTNWRRKWILCKSMCVGGGGALTPMLEGTRELPSDWPLFLAPFDLLPWVNFFKSYQIPLTHLSACEISLFLSCLFLQISWVWQKLAGHIFTLVHFCVILFKIYPFYIWQHVGILPNCFPTPTQQPMWDNILDCDVF